jgi:fatty acid desaturase
MRRAPSPSTDDEFDRGEGVADTARMTPCSLADLRRELDAAGLGQPAALKTYAKFLVLIAASFGLLFWIVSSELAWWEQVPAACLSGWLLTAAAMCGHDAAHGVTSDRPWVNSLLASLGFALLGGLSVNYWKHKHNVLHHPFVNLAQKDPDIEQSLLALSKRQHEKHGPLIRWLQCRVQAIAFWLGGAPLVVVDLRVTSIRYLVAELRKGQHRGSDLVDLVCVLAHYVIWLVLPLAFLGWQTVFLVYAISTPLLGVFLTLIFAPAHMPYPLVRESNDPLLLQLSSTRDFSTNRFLGFTLVGLNRQIEHHLAQKLNHFDLEKAAPIVRDYCARHGLPYHETGWLRALVDTSRQIHRGWSLDEVVLGESPSPR